MQMEKIDRKLLPSPEFLSTQIPNQVELLQPTNQTELIIHRIWCDIFKQNQISIDTNIFTIGGHSLLIMQLFHHTKLNFISNQTLFLLVIYFNIQQLFIMLNSFIKVSTSHKTLIIINGLHYISLKVGETFYHCYQLCFIFIFCSSSIICSRTHLLR